MLRLFCFAVLLLVAGLPHEVVQAQPAPGETAQRYEIVSVDVEGGGDVASEQYVLQSSGLRVGQSVTLPYDEAFAEAVRRLYRGGLFSDVEVVADRVLGDGVYLLIRVTEEPRLAAYTIEGVSRGERDDLAADLPLLRGRAVRPTHIGGSMQRITRNNEGKG